MLRHIAKGGSVLAAMPKEGQKVEIARVGHLAQEGPQEGRFTRAVGADEGGQFAAMEVHRDVVQHAVAV